MIAHTSTLPPCALPSLRRPWLVVETAIEVLILSQSAFVILYQRLCIKVILVNMNFPVFMIKYKLSQNWVAESVVFWR